MLDSVGPSAHDRMMSAASSLGFRASTTKPPQGGKGGASVGVVELSRVRTRAAVDVAGRELPGGSVGTVVHVYAGRDACEVEFTQPFQAVVTLAMDQFDRHQD